MGYNSPDDDAFSLFHQRPDTTRITNQTPNTVARGVWASVELRTNAGSSLVISKAAWLKEKSPEPDFLPLLEDGPADLRLEVLRTLAVAIQEENEIGEKVCYALDEESCGRFRWQKLGLELRGSSIEATVYIFHEGGTSVRHFEMSTNAEGWFGLTFVGGDPTMVYE